MRFIIENPTKAYMNSYLEEELLALEKELSYKNEAYAYDVKRHINNKWLRSKNHAIWEKKLKELQSLVNNTLVFQDEKGPYIRPGSIPYVKNIQFTVENKIKYSSFKKIAWAHKLPFELYPYQEESVKKLLDVKHGNVELTTGSGKTIILLKLLRESGLSAVVIVPSVSIFNEILGKAEYFLGKGLVGGYGDGKKNIDKKITIAIGDSLVNIKDDTKEQKFFREKQMFISDESHLLPSETLEKVCHKLLENIPYRFFLSGTQTRNDGTEKLLQSIIGPTVHTLSTKEAVEKGYICPHKFRIVRVESSNPNFNSKEPLEEKRVHFLGNKNIAAFIAKLANFEGSKGRQTLVLVEELHQISSLIKLLNVPYAYAHSSKNKEDLEKRGIEKVDSKEAVDKFNKNEVKVLIGTSCISTGTNIFPCHNTVNWAGGSSEIKTKQGAVGRSIRLHSHNPFKDRCLLKEKCIIYDFDVVDNYTMREHLKQRIIYYRDSGTEIEFLTL